MASLKFDITGDNKNVLDSFNGVQQGVRQMQSTVERSGQSIETMFQRVTSSALGGVKQLAAGVAGLTALMESGSFIKTLYADMGKFTVAMKEVSTLSEDVTNNLEEYKQRVVELCTQIAIAPEEAAKALYQIESAGHHGADGLKVLEESAKGAIGGVTETEVAADAITTILNSYKMSAEEAARVNDLLFTTVRLGKTTYGELGRVIAQVTPVASAYGVAIEDVLAAVASLTKSGTKTSIAVRQVRDAITATTNSLGDGAFRARSFLEAMDEVAEKTKGSESALKSDLSKLSAMNAVLALTGKNAASAKQDFIDMQNSAGAATAAYEKMANTGGNATLRLKNNLFAYFMPLGDEIRSMSKSIAESLNDAFDDGSMQKALTTLEAFIASYALYRGLLAGQGFASGLSNTASLAATNAAYDAEIAQLQTIIPLKQAEAQSDLEIAVAEGKLTPEKAALITSIREEAAAHLANLQAEAAEAKVKFEESTTIAAQAALRLEEAETAVAAAEMKYAAAVQSGNATAAETAELELNTAISNKNVAAKELQTAREVAKTAATRASATATLADSAATAIDSAAQKTDATATGVLAGAKLTLKRAIDAVNASFLASPLFWMAATVIGVTYGIYKLVTAETAAEAATRKANEAMEKQNELNEQRAQNVQNLLRTIQDKNASDLQQLAAYNELKTLMPEITDKYTLQALATMDATESQKELNEALDNANYDDVKKQIAELEDKLANFQTSLQNSLKNAGQGAGVVADAAYKQKAVWEETLNRLRAQLADMDKLRTEAAEAEIPIEIRIKEAEENLKVKQDILDFYNQAVDIAENWQLANDTINFDTGKSRVEEFIEYAEAEIADLHEQQRQNPFDLNLQMRAEEKQKILDSILQMKNDMDAMGYTTIPLFFTANWQSLQKAVADARAAAQGLIGQTVAGGALSLQEEFDAAQTKFQTAQSKLDKITSDMKNHTKEELISAQSELKTAKEAWESLGGDPEGKSAKRMASAAKSAANERAQRIKAEQKYQELLRQQALDRERTAKDLEFSTEQAIIDSMEESSQKTIKQITLDFARQAEELKRGYEDLRQQKIDAAKRLWEADPANKGKAFDASKVDTSYTEEETNDYNARLAAAKAAYVRQINELSKLEVQNMYDYLKEYGSMQSQKLAIAREYAEKIAKEEDAWRKKALQKEMQSAIDSITAENLLKQIDLGSVFSEYGKILAAPLEQTIKQLEEYTASSSFKSRSIEDQKSIFEAIENAKKQLGEIGKVSFQQLGENLYEYNNALVAFNNASEELSVQAQNVIETENALKEAREKAAKATTDADKAEAKRAVNLAEANADAARERYAQAETAYSDAQSRMVKAQQAASSSLSDLNNSIEGVGNIAKAVASGSMKQLWDALGAKAQTRIGQFVAGSHSYENAIKLMTSSLGENGKGMDFFVEKIQEMTANILSSGEDISNSNIGQKISELFGSIFGDDASKLDAVQDKIGKAIGDILNNAKDTGEETDETIKKAGDAAIQAITKSSGSIWGLIIGLIFDLLDVLAEGIGGLVETILSKVGAAIEGILTNIGSGKFFEQLATGVGNIVGGIIKGVANLFSGGFAFGGSNEDEMEDRINELAIANKALATSIDALTKQIGKKDSTNYESIEAYQKALQAEIDWEKNQREAINSRASEWTNTGYGFLKLGGKGSFNAHMAGNDWYGWREFTEALREHGYDREVNRNNIWELTPEEMEILRDFRPSEWAALFNGDGHRNPQELVEEYIQRAGMQESLTSALNEKLTGYSWDGFLDAYKSLLKDLDSTTEDFAEHINELISNALIEGFVNSAAIKDKIRELYEKIALYASSESEGGTELTENEINDIRSKNEDIANTLMSWRKAAMQAGLIVNTEEEAQEAKEYFSSLRESFLSTLTDMEADAESWKKEITRIMVEDLVSSMVLGDDFTNWLDDWKDRYKAAVDFGDIDTIKQLREELGRMREQLSGQAQTIMDDLGYTEMMEGVDELESAFDDLHSKFLSTLMDMDADAETWSKEITKTMIEQLIERNLLNEAFDSKLDDWRQRFEDVLSDTTLSDVERESRLAALRAELEALRESLSAEAQKYLDSLGYSEMMTEKEKSPFKDLRTQFLNTLMDMEGDAENFRKDLNKILTQSLIEKFILNDEFDEYLEEWNNRYMEILTDGNRSQEEIEAALDAMIEELVQKRELTLEQAEKLRERLQEVEEETPDTTFKDMADSWVNTLMDMDATAEDWAEEIGRTMAKKIVEQMISTTMIQPLLDQLQDAFNTAMSAEGATWQSVLPELTPYIDQMKTAFGDMQPIVEQILNAFGIFKEVEEEVKEGFSDLRGSFVSALMDMEADADKFAKDIARIMTEQMVSRIIEMQFQDQIDALNAEWYDALQAGDTEALERIRQKLIELQKLCGEAVQPLLDDLAAIEYVAEEVDETITSLRDDFLSALMDMKAGTQDFVNDIKKLLTQKMVEKSVLNEQFDAWINGIQSKYESILNSGMSEQQMADAMNRLAAEWEAKAKEMQLQTERIFDITGWSSILEQMNSPLADLRSNFRSALMDMESDTQDFAKEISDLLTEAFIDKFVLGDEFEKRLAEWQEQYASIMKGNYSEDERALLLRELQAAITAAKDGYAEEAKAIHDLMGTTMSTDQTATINMADKATYDQFETYLGIAVAQQMATLQGNEVRLQILATLQGMTGITTPGGDTVREIRSMLTTTNEYLLDLKRSNRDILSQFGAKLDSIINKLTGLI